MHISSLELRLNDIISAIRPVDFTLERSAMARIDRLAKPVGSLGKLEKLAARLFAVQNGVTPLAADPAMVVTIAGDHGVTAEGISSSPSVVTRQQVHNFLNGGGGISVLCRTNAVRHLVVDAGVTGDDFVDHPMLLCKKIAPGTANITQGPAMSREECLKALLLGWEIAQTAHAASTHCLGTGEMGIGNTTPSTALFSAFLELDPVLITGPGAGLPPSGLEGKVAVIRKALHSNASAINSKDPVAILAAVGGLEIAALTGLILGASNKGIPVMVDGFISTAAYVAAYALAPAIAGYCFFSHASAEPGHALIMERLGACPLIDLDFRLGEGTGAVFGIVLLRNAAAIFNEMALLDEAGISGSAQSRNHV